MKFIPPIFEISIFGFKRSLVVIWIFGILGEINFSGNFSFGPFVLSMFIFITDYHNSTIKSERRSIVAKLSSKLGPTRREFIDEI